MKPGATTRPVTSMIRSAEILRRSPMAMMVSSRRATSAANAGRPVPSMISPPVSTVSACRKSVATVRCAFTKFSKKCLEAAEDSVAVVDLQQHGPLVEGGAGMRYVEAQKIADGQVHVRRHGQITVLVVEFVNGQSVNGTGSVMPPFAKPPTRHGQVDVV